ncbi:guanylate kinase [Acephala macrosclerotiorum]|nr:guanylate kinase [Acephala macrosclerotiorum]
MAPVPSDLRPVVISGPSGVGKGTLYKLLLERHPSLFSTSVSHTTRSPRPGEKHGVDYYYISMSEFEKMIEENKFVENAKFGDNRYGTSKMTIEDLTRSGRVVVLDIEMEGVKQIKASSVSARFVFIAPPSMTVLESRLRGRGTEKEESIQKRLAQAKNEMAYAETPGAHNLIIVNDDLEKAYQELESFIFKDRTQDQEAGDASKAVSVQD